MTERIVATPQGDARLVTDRARKPIATLVLGHGAGAGIDTQDLVALAAELPRHGITVVRLEQPWRVAGRKLATAPPTLDEALVAATDTMRVRTPLVVGGRSAGARSAVRSAKAMGARGALCLAFPLHPPGQPEKSRLPELRGARVPVLVVQGERDPMGRPEEFPADLDLAVVPGGDHSLKVPARGPLTQDEADALVVEAVLEWIVRQVTG